MVSFLRRRSPALGIFPAIAFILAAAPGLRADVIIFLNGNVLIVDRAWVEGDQVKYQTSRGVQSVATVDVREIQEESAPSPRSPQRWGIGVVESQSEASAPASTSRGTAESTGTLSRLRENLRVDPANAKAKAELTYALNSLAALQVADGDLTGAAASLEEAFALDRRNPAILENLGIIHLRRGRFREAEELLRTGLELDRDNKDFHYLLGEAYYGQEKISEAIDAWSAGLRLGPHPEMSKRLETALGERRVHDEMGGIQSAHFILRYDREVSDRRLGQTVLATLEKLYTELSIELVSEPPETIAVILYPDQTYFNITRAASWSGALFDGKIRIPTRGLNGITPELRAVLTHELTHAFVASLAADCPGWFNEGLAQFAEGQSAASHKEELARLHAEDQLIPLGDLEGSFVGFSPDRAELAYVEGLSAVEYLVSRFGKLSIRRILDLLAQNDNFENAFRRVAGRSVYEFETVWRLALASSAN